MRPEPFSLRSKRIRSWEDQLSGGFIHHFEPIRALKILFYLGGKRFQCPGPGNTLTLISLEKKDPLRTRIPECEFLKRAFRTPNRTEGTIYIYIYIYATVAVNQGKVLFVSMIYGQSTLVAGNDRVTHSTSMDFPLNSRASDVKLILLHGRRRHWDDAYIGRFIWDWWKQDIVLALLQLGYTEMYVYW